VNADLFAPNTVQDVVRVRLYADEILAQKNSLGETWMYIGVLAIPEHRYTTALHLLNEARGQAGYANELHFVNLRNYSYAHIHNQKTSLAKRWVRHFLDDDEKIFHFYLLGLNLTRLHHSSFGPSQERDENMYNRFFRSAIHYVLKAFFVSQHSSVVVSQLFHDQGKLVHHKYFDWHTIWRLGQTIPNVRFECDNILFIDSDHNKETQWSDESHFVQLCDILLGGFSHCLDDRNKKDGCCEIATDLLPLAERLTASNPFRNPNSRYHYLNRVHLSFFPSKELAEDEMQDPLARARSKFYSARPLLYKDRSSGQLSFW